ncbi:protein of unknown function [Shinella sp. WSC3-e]|nr:hypothetical protein SHINE37_44622 [Rhizobiaceae bacterium]CAK7259104.1 protein of unknown function [Shinella sp. WSC3-e]
MTKGVGCIYGIYSRLAGRIVYVGQTRQSPNARWAQHKQRHTPLARQLRATGIEFFSFHVLEEAPVGELNARECHWIDKLDTMHPQGLNHKPGGRAKGTSARVKQKLSATSKAAWGDPAHREKQRVSRKEKWADPEHKAKMAAIRKATWAAPGFREKMRVARQDSYQDPVRRASQAAAMRNKWADPQYKADVGSKIAAAIGASEKFKQGQSRRAKRRHSSNQA